MEYASKLVEQAVDEIAQLPGIGKRTAMRLVLFLLRQPETTSLDLAEAISNLRTKIQYCTSCFNISDLPICSICANPKRQKDLVCVVEDVRDVMAIESTGQFNGLYHVLGGKISPLDGIGPQELEINSLVEKVKSGTINELILALSSTMEGDTTNFYIYKQVSPYNVSVTTIARGVAVGDELEYADEVSLGRSIVKRIPFDGTI
ncbi:MAG: recombination protein RecR [Flavobacteriaceae bacterium]|jgi:recombination protein RecR|nr:recombination protein RecR [Flavobacteriaceae bacterium]